MMQLKPIGLIALIVLASMTGYLTPAQAQNYSNFHVASDPPKPPKRGTPSGREPAGTRGPCEETAIPLTPMLPLIDSEFSGLTLNEHPTFWFYVPYQSDSVSRGRFAIEDVEGNLVYRLRFKLPEKPGFVSVTIPTTEQPLEYNKQYRWTFTLYCANQPSDQPNFVFHQGRVQRVERDNLEAQLKTANRGEQINLYLENHLWYDASAELAQTRNLPHVWLKLLSAMDLEMLSQEAIAGAVVPIES